MLKSIKMHFEIIYFPQIATVLMPWIEKNNRGVGINKLIILFNNLITLVIKSCYVNA